MAKKQWELGANDEVALKDDFTLTGGALPTGGYVSSLFSSDNTSLNAAIDAEIASRCASLDPAKSSIADIINALKGTN